MCLMNPSASAQPVESEPYDQIAAHVELVEFGTAGAKAA